MPRRDGTGPEGMGPMTGRKAGKCNSKAHRQSTGNNELSDNRNFTDEIRGFFRRSFGNNDNRPGSGRGNRRKDI